MGPLHAAPSLSRKGEKNVIVTKAEALRQAEKDREERVRVYGAEVAEIIEHQEPAYWDGPESYYEHRLGWSLPLAYAEDLNDDPKQLVHEMLFMAADYGVRGVMNFIIYTFDPCETPVKFRTMQICEHATLREALQELYRQIERLEENGIYRTAVAWETFNQERPVTTTFEDTEKRVRFIVEQYGKVGSGVSHGVLDLDMARRLAGGTVAQQLKMRPKVPVEAHMPAEQKASPEDCMLAIRIVCGVSTHDPMKKFEKRD